MPQSMGKFATQNKPTRAKANSLQRTRRFLRSSTGFPGRVRPLVDHLLALFSIPCLLCSQSQRQAASICIDCTRDLPGYPKAVQTALFLGRSIKRHAAVPFTLPSMNVAPPLPTSFQSKPSSSASKILSNFTSGGRCRCASLMGHCDQNKSRIGSFLYLHIGSASESEDSIQRHLSPRIYPINWRFLYRAD